MGNKLFLPHLWKEDEPDSFADIKYHPQFGFDAERIPKCKSNKPNIFY